MSGDGPAPSVFHRRCLAYRSVVPVFLAAHTNCITTDPKRSHRERTGNRAAIFSKRRLEMQNTVSKLFRPPMAIVALWATICTAATFAAPAAGLSGGTTSPTLPDRGRPELSPPIARWTDSATQNRGVAKSQRRMERDCAYPSSPHASTLAPNQIRCQFVRAELIDSNGPHGGWCWRITTKCDQYLQGDCWYTEESTAIQVPSLK